MLKVTRDNQARALQVLHVAFKNIPGALWILKKDKYVQQRLKVLCQFCLSAAMQKNGAFISSDAKGVALIFESGLKQHPVKWLLGYIKLGNYCIGWSRAWAIIQREKFIVSQRPKFKHLYFWMVGIEDHSNGLNTIIEIRDFSFDYSRRLQLPIYAETTVEQNLTLYLRYGFVIYNVWETGSNGIKVWFIRRDWNL